MFEMLFSIFAINCKVVTLSQSLNTKILQHFIAPEDEFECYFL